MKINSFNSTQFNTTFRPRSNKHDNDVARVRTNQIVRTALAPQPFNMESELLSSLKIQLS